MPQLGESGNKNQLMNLEEKDKTRKFIGVGLLCIASICIIWGDTNNNSTILRFGKITLVVGIIFYFSDKIRWLTRKNFKKP